MSSEQEEKSTPRPWIVERMYDGGRTICSMRATDMLLCVNAGLNNLRPYDSTEANAELIVTAVNERDQLLSFLAEKQEEIEKLKRILVKAAIPYEALIIDTESRRWIAPSIWSAMQEAAVETRAALNPISEPTGG